MPSSTEATRSALQNGSFGRGLFSNPAACSKRTRKRLCSFFDQESPRQTKPKKGRNEKFMNLTLFCEFGCFLLAKQAQFTSNFGSNLPREKFMNRPFFGLVCWNDSWFDPSLSRDCSNPRSFRDSGDLRDPSSEKTPFRNDPFFCRSPQDGQITNNCHLIAAVRAKMPLVQTELVWQQASGYWFAIALSSNFCIARFKLLQLMDLCRKRTVLSFTRDTLSTAENSMTSSERPSPEPLLKKEASPTVLRGREFCSGGFKRLEVYGVGVTSRTLEGNSGNSCESPSRVRIFPEFLGQKFSGVSSGMCLGVWPINSWIEKQPKEECIGLDIPRIWADLGGRPGSKVRRPQNGNIWRWDFAVKFHSRGQFVVRLDSIGAV